MLNLWKRIHLPLLCKDLFQEKLLKIHATCKAEFRSWKFYKSLFHIKFISFFRSQQRQKKGPGPTKRLSISQIPPPPQPSPIWTSLEKLIKLIPWSHKWTTSIAKKEKKKTGTKENWEDSTPKGKPTHQLKPTKPRILIWPSKLLTSHGAHCQIKVT